MSEFETKQTLTPARDRSNGPVCDRQRGVSSVYCHRRYEMNWFAALGLSNASDSRPQ